MKINKPKSTFQCRLEQMCKIVNQQSRSGRGDWLVVSRQTAPSLNNILNKDD